MNEGTTYTTLILECTLRGFVAELTRLADAKQSMSLFSTTCWIEAVFSR